MIQETKYSYDYINPSFSDNPKGQHAPSFRGENQLIIYTDEFIGKTSKNGTGVNPWGFEAAVNKNGIVVETSDRVTIPANGFVVSGNQKACDFIKKHIFLGSVVEILYDTKEILIKTNKIKSIVLSLKQRKKEVNHRFNTAIKNAYDLNYTKIKALKIKADTIIKQIKNISNKNNLTLKEKEAVLKLENKAQLIFDELYLLTSPSFSICSRNAWIRPSEQNLDEIIKILNVCKNCNINGIYVESFYNGDIPGISKITNTSKEVVNGYYGEEYKNDYLKALISEAHKRNIEIHAWVECFFVGEKSNQWKSWYKDSWHMINFDGSTVQGNNDYNLENDFIWLDPANPECLEYVLSIYKELLTNYEFDGINVDYVRYPYGNAELWSSNGYSEYAINEFLRTNNLKGDIRKLIENKNIHELWVNYRCQKITTLMCSVRKLVKEIRPNCLISTAVCSDLNYAIYNKMQNWKVWARNGWLDLTLPMAYYTGCSEIAVATKELVDFNNEKAFSYTGILSIQPNEPYDLIIKQINTLFDNKADGYAVFHLGDIINNKKLQKALKLSVNRNKAIHPHTRTKTLIKVFIKDLSRRQKYFYLDITNVINELSQIKDYSYTNLLSTLKKLVTKNKDNKQIINEINKIIHYLKIQKNIKEA